MTNLQFIGSIIVGFFTASLPATVIGTMLDPEDGVGGTVFWIAYAIFLVPCIKWATEYQNEMNKP